MSSDRHQKNAFTNGDEVLIKVLRQEKVTKRRNLYVSYGRPTAMILDQLTDYHIWSVYWN